MTDNTPRPELMSRESVLTVLESAMRYPPSIEDLMKVRAAVAALYERCEALERALHERNMGFWVWGKRHPMTSFSTGGTEASDAEGRG